MPEKRRQYTQEFKDSATALPATRSSSFATAARPRGGNSGSPVFNRQLKTFAIHHRALEEMRLNEGILLNEIKAALAQ